MKQEMKSFLNQIYDHESDSGEYGINYFARFIPKLEKYDFAEILAYLVNDTNTSLEYILELILSTPSLWTNFSVTDWVRVMSLLNPRPEPLSRDIKSEGYVDIHFLCKYIRINAVELFLQQKRFSKEDKKKILQYSKKIVTFLFMDEIDAEDLDGDYYLHKNELENVRLNLIFNGKVKPLDCTKNELQKYIKEELEKYQ